MIKTCKCIVINILLLLFISNINTLPLLPLILPQTPLKYFKYNDEYKQIPKIIWTAVKNSSDELPYHIQQLFNRNNDWEVHICDNECKDTFMNKYFNNTAILQTYNLINQEIAAVSKADIWRYCILYTYGGLYIDDDSDIKTLLNEIVRTDDTMILSEEGPSSLGDCYISSFHLSDTATFDKYKHNYSNAQYYHGIDNKSNKPIFFHGNTILNWAVFTKPRHALLYHTLENINEIIQSEYHRYTYLHINKWDVRWKYVMCSTVFIFGYTLREMLLQNTTEFYYNQLNFEKQQNYSSVENTSIQQNNGSIENVLINNTLVNQFIYTTNIYPITFTTSSNNYLPIYNVIYHSNQEFLINHTPRICSHDFFEYSGKAKAIWTGGNKNHYMKAMSKYKHVPYLNDYIPLDINKYMNYLDGVIVIGDGKEMYLISNKSRRSFPDFETFLYYNISLSAVRHIKDSILLDIPIGSPLRSVLDPPLISVADSKLDSQKDSKTDKEVDLPTLLSIQRNISMDCYSDSYEASSHDFINKKYISYYNNVNIFVYPMCLSSYQLGNTLGYYFNALACSILSKSNFIGVNRQYISIQEKSFDLSYYLQKSNNSVSSTDTSIEESIQLVKKNCPCTKYCWENENSPWLNALNDINNYLNTATTTYYNMINSLSNISMHTLLNNETDYIYIPIGMTDRFISIDLSNQLNTNKYNNHLQILNHFHDIKLPILPNITIQYRCGDNIGFGKTRYGLLPFSIYLSILLKHPHYKYIYIIADSPTRSYNAYSSRCSIILQKFANYLINSLTDSVVIIKRGGDLFLDYYRLIYSNITICSASSYCLWPMLANNQVVYYPSTPLVPIDKLRIKKTNGMFNIINDSYMIKIFKSYRPWTNVFIDLEKDYLSDKYIIY